jgi:EmrB/QacA subfamily drug resistance transporter
VRSRPPHVPIVTQGSVIAQAAPDDAPNRTRWLVFAGVSVALLMGSIDQTSVATALPALQADLDTALSWGGWTITVYLVGQIVAMPLAGRFCEQFGRKRVLLVAVGLFTVASVCCALVRNIETLIAFRLLHGLAGGALMPAATAIVADQFGRDRDRAIALFTSIFPIGAIIGPVVGGVLVAATSWRGIFWINVPIGLLVLVVGYFTITESYGARRGRVDTVGIVMLVTILLTGMYAITRTGSLGTGWFGPVTAGAAALAAIGTGFLFVWHIRRHPSPLVPIELLRGRDFGALNTVNIMFGMAALGIAALVPHYAQSRFGAGPLLAGGLLTLRAFGMIAASTCTILLIRRLGHRPLLLIGFGIHTVGLAMLALPPLGLDPLAWLAVAAGVTGVGMGLAAPASNNAGMHLAPDQISAISGLRGMFRQSGGIVGISLTTAFVSASSDPDSAQALAFGVMAVLLLAAIPVALRIPNHRGRW